MFGYFVISFVILTGCGTNNPEWIEKSPAPNATTISVEKSRPNQPQHLFLLDPLDAFHDGVLINTRDGSLEPRIDGESDTNTMSPQASEDLVEHKRIDKLIFMPLYLIETVAIVITNSWLINMLLRGHSDTKRNFSFAVQCFFTLRAFGDLFSGLICIPLHLYMSFYSRVDPSRPHKVCREAAALWYLEEVGAYISSYSILAIALSRFRAVIMIFAKRPSKKQTIMITMFILLLALTLPVPFLVVKLRFTHGILCEYTPRQFKSHLSYLIIIGMGFPYTTAVILYSIIIRKLEASKVGGGDPNNKEGFLNFKQSNDKKDRSIRLIWWLIGIFVMCNLPILCFHFFANTFNIMNLSQLSLERLLHSMALWFTMIRWLNPLVVIIFGTQVAKYKFVRVMTSFFTKSGGYSSILTSRTTSLMVLRDTLKRKSKKVELGQGKDKGGSATKSEIPKSDTNGTYHKYGPSQSQDKDQIFTVNLEHVKDLSNYDGVKDDGATRNKGE